MPGRERIRFKGTLQGVHLIIESEGPLQEVLTELDQRLKSTDQFFRSAGVQLNLGDRPMDGSDYGALREILDRYGLSVVSAIAAHTETRSVLRGQGVSVEMPPHPDGGILAAKQPASNGNAHPAAESTQGVGPGGLVVQRTLRSGQAIQHEADICLVGDVNPGAELVSGGSIIVWGSVRGVVQAGSSGNERSIICALELAPSQLRIASVVTRPPEGEQESIPEMARIVEGQIIVEQWLPRSRRTRR